MSANGYLLHLTRFAGDVRNWGLFSEEFCACNLSFLLKGMGKRFDQ
jgi:muconolactone delta-isomerase